MSVAAREGRLYVRAEESQLLRWKADAVKAGKPFSAWVRECLNAGTKRLAGEVGGPAAQARHPAYVTPARSVRIDPAMRVSPLPEDAKAAARSLSHADGRCMADAPRGMRCKVCGRVH